MKELVRLVLPIGMVEVLIVGLFLFATAAECSAVIRVKLMPVLHVLASLITSKLRSFLTTSSKVDGNGMEDIVLRLLGSPISLPCPSPRLAQERHLTAREAGGGEVMRAPVAPIIVPEVACQPRNQTQPAAETPDTPVPTIEAMLVTASPSSWIDPISGRRQKLRPLPSREVEMRSLNRLLGGTELHMVPAAVWPLDVHMALQGAVPRVLVLSGHWHGSCWAAENEQREARLVSGEEFGAMLAGRLPEVLVLNGCMSSQFAETLLSQLRATPRSHDVYLISCTTKLHDKFAAQFCQSLCSLLTKNNSCEPLPVPEAFCVACRQYDGQQGHMMMGDPATYLHTELLSPQVVPPHPYNPGCPGCNPPVHGSFQLVTLQKTGAAMITQPPMFCES
eukprot:TRINITY_DN25957_c0_g1_i1.p1 TRINITY_DN25957_c0_g1~~TRINITY_DN25957_c0_g1_i1.p1  ORF type:complete len:392 (+),score=62.69 TRINITY_DN25957_c0_g1_i1:309-1484(+)